MDGEPHAASEAFDAFQHYSNDLVRMKKILLKADDSKFGMANLLAVLNADATVHVIEDLDNTDQKQATNSVGAKNQGSITKRRRANDLRPIKQGVERKTRLSFECHPYLIMHDVFEDESLATRASTIEEESDEES